MSTEETSPASTRVIGTATNQIDVTLDPSLPPDRIELRRRDGRVLGAVKISTVERDVALEAYLLKMIDKGGALAYAAPLDPDTPAVDEIEEILDDQPAPITLARPLDGVLDQRILDLVADLRRKTEAATAAFIVSPAQARLDEVLDEVLADAVVTGSGFMRVDFRPTLPDESPTGDWEISRVDPTRVEIRDLAARDE